MRTDLLPCRRYFLFAFLNVFVAVSILCSGCKAGAPQEKASSLKPAATPQPINSNLDIGFSLPYSPASPQSEEALEHGIAALEQKQFQKALSACEIASQSAPDNAKAQFYLAVSLDRMGFHKKAQTHFLKALSLDLPQFYDVWPAFKLSKPSETYLANLTSELRPKWQEAYHQGIPVILWQDGTWVEDAYQYPIPKLLRAGVYISKSGLDHPGRFVPLGTPQDNIVSAEFIPSLPAVISIQADRNFGMPSSLSNITLHILDPLGQSPNSTINLKPKVPQAEALELSVENQRVYVRARNFTDDFSASEWLTDRDTPAVNPNPFKLVFAEGEVPLDANTNYTMSNGTLEVRQQLSNFEAMNIVSLMGCKWDELNEVEAYTHHIIESNDNRAPISKGASFVVASPAGDKQTFIQKGQATYLVNHAKLGQPNKSLFDLASPLPPGLFISAPMTPKICSYL